MYKMETFTFDDAGEDLIRLTTRVLNPDQTGYMGHTTVPDDEADNFWQGANEALKFANDHHEEYARGLDFRQVIGHGEHETTDHADSYALGVLAVAKTWQPRLTLDELKASPDNPQ